jgi:sporulation protein YlmC with PRC-barrel domain
VLHSAKKLDRCRILATDGAIGTVEEIYFDDEQWVVRYLIVDTGGWLKGRRVLISPYAVKSIDWDTREVAIDLTRYHVQHSPGIDTDKPVSRQQEAEYHRYYGYPQYWPNAAYWAWGAIPMVVPPDPQARVDAEAQRRAEAHQVGADAHLRSSKAVLGYRIQASDDLIGHVVDFLFDEETWAIRHLVVATQNWLPGKQVLIAPERIRAVSWAERTVSVALTREEIERSPEFDPRNPPSRDSERALHEHYSPHRDQSFHRPIRRT